MRIIKKIGIVALFMTMLMAVNVFAEETTEDPWTNFETVDPWENIPTVEQTYPEGYWGHPDGKCGVIVNVLDYGIDEDHDLYGVYDKFIMKLVENDFEYHIYLKDANGNTYKAEVGSGMSWNYYLYLEPGTYTITKIEWDPTNEDFVEMDSKYIYTNTVTFDTNESDVLVNLDLIRLINDSGVLDKDIINIKINCSELFDYVFAGQNDPMKDPNVEEMTENNIVMPSNPAETNPTDEYIEPTLESEENDTVASEEDITKADEDGKKTNGKDESDGFSKWFIIVPVISVVVILGVVIVIMITKKKK